ncbi:hypothetical protein [Carboxylicivirga marina]|uniref:hypothetical protein n=1 Tax=Carboxylicivirga marina TaxID=2800988 RepID=UPI002597D0BD|nr:hypothetical protein [uncultured Carboxylicivirga sp.]
MRKLFCLLFLIPLLLKGQPQSIVLNGQWQCGENRVYNREVSVPGLASDPTKINQGVLWYKKEIVLPEGAWLNATLELKGARFMPKVYIDGDLVSEKAGGMSPTLHPLKHKNIKPGKKVSIEIALASLKDMPKTDASRIPKADYWRSDVAAHLWDDVVLKVHGTASINHVHGYSDLKEDAVHIKYRLESESVSDYSALQISIIDDKGNTVIDKSYKIDDNQGELIMPVSGKLKLWEPETPHLYRLITQLKKGKKVIDTDTCNYGHREFKVVGKQFELNGHPVKMRAASVVWYRWLRYPEVKELAWDTQWFEENIIKRMKAHGANTLRFHLGMPPQKFLDLCDKHGLLVQAEWHFFHGLEASKESLTEQWASWFDVSSRYPSNVLMHGWNETDEEQLKIAYEAISEVAENYPGLVIGHRDVIHVHKYWWSLFENVGVFYDSYDEFPLPVMADEYGGNYLDELGDVGGYPMVESAYARFLGKGHSKAQRFYHHALSNAKISEYWRTIGVAGFSPFCALGSPEDGNHWFLGDITQGNPMPVWNALTAAWSPVSVSLNIWNRNFLPGQEIEVPVVLFNDTDMDKTIRVKYSLEDPQYRQAVWFEITELPVSKYSRAESKIQFALPRTAGDWLLKAEVLNAPEHIKYPVVSEWDIRTFEPKPNTVEASVNVGVIEEDTHLHTFLKQNHLSQVPAFDKEADVILLSKNAWDNYITDEDFIKKLEKALQKGTDVILLDVGPFLLGQGYNNSLQDLQGVRKSAGESLAQVNLPLGVKASFKEVAEPESHIHPNVEQSPLWNHLSKESTWLWNGLKGGLIVPSVGFELSGLSQASFVESWSGRGADSERIKKGSYYAYELEGFYAYSALPNDRALQDSLRQAVKFLVEDAPALKQRVNPNAKILKTNLVELYQKSAEGKAEALIAHASAGRNLVKTPVYEVSFGKEYGELMISQLITHKRLDKNLQPNYMHEIAYDPVAVQMVLNMIDYLSQKK